MDEAFSPEVIWIESGLVESCGIPDRSLLAIDTAGEVRRGDVAVVERERRGRTVWVAGRVRRVTKTRISIEDDTGPDVYRLADTKVLGPVVACYARIASWQRSPVDLMEWPEVLREKRAA